MLPANRLQKKEEKINEIYNFSTYNNALKH